MNHAGVELLGARCGQGPGSEEVQILHVHQCRGWVAHLSFKRGKRHAINARETAMMPRHQATATRAA